MCHASAGVYFPASRRSGAVTIWASAGRSGRHNSCLVSRDSDLVRVGDAAELLGVDAVRVYEAIDAGELPAVRVDGHGIRIARSDVDSYRGAH